MIEPTIHSIPPDTILIPEERQRRTVEDSYIEELAQSISARGLIHTVLVTPVNGSPVLVAGYCRVRAHILLDREVECRYCVDPTEEELIALELEENVKRRELAWEDRARAIAKFHDHRLELDSTWTLEKTAESLGFSKGHMSAALSVAREMEKEGGAEFLSTASGLMSAAAAVNRKNTRAVEAELDIISRVGVEQELPEEAETGPLPSETTILNEDFIKWVHAYRGPRFNLIHCDFPYGIGMDSANLQGSSPTTHAGMYEDGSDVYWRLLRAFLLDLDTFCAPSAHIIFWLSGSISNIRSTCAEIHARDAEADLDLIIQDFPLIWHKSDSAGIIPDTDRYGRRTYEVALFITRGDRKIVRPVNLSCSFPTERATRLHPSEKPLPVLHHFFRMVVDGSTRLLDPTCGSGTSIRAAESLGAATVLGLEIDAEHCDSARVALSKHRQHATDLAELVV